MRKEAPPLLMALALLAGQTQADNYVKRAVFWEPYVSDPQTTVLCHFDGRQDVAMGDLLDAATKPGEDELIRVDAPATGEGAGRKTVNDVLMKGTDVPLLGACEEVKGEGRFGGALRLAGKDGRVAVRGSPGLGWTLEGWFKAASLPKERATLFDLPRWDMSVRVSLMADGRLAAQWMAAKDPTLSEWRCKPGEWFHLAMVWKPATLDHTGSGVSTAELLALVNGQPALRSGVQPAGVFQGTLAQAASVGNDGQGQAGFDGWLDELRLSPRAREFYSMDLDWVDATGARPTPEGQPFFRDERELLLHLGFDRTLKPLAAPAGLSFPELGPKELGDEFDPNRWTRHFGDGVRREALELKPGAAEARYQGQGFALPDRGTLAFWFRPLNWDNYKLWNQFADFPRKSVPLFRVRQEGVKDAVLAFSVLQTPDNTAYRLLDVNPGRWVHLAVVWDGKQDVWYADGKPWPHWGTFEWSRQGWDAAKPLTLVFERDAETKTSAASGCAVDDFRVYPRPLAPSEVRNLAALHDRRVELKPLLPVEMKVDYNGVIGHVDVELYPLHPDYRRAAEARVAVTAVGAAKPLATRTFDLTANPSPRGRIETGPMDFGDFQVTADIRDAAGKPLFDNRFAFTRAQPPWWKNKLGLSERVMPDWKAVEVKTGNSNAGSRKTEGEGAVIGVSLREIHLGEAGLPRKIVSLGEDILAGPVELIVTVEGKETPLTPVPGAFRAETRGEVRADFSGKAQSAGVAAEIKGYVEFDGFTWFEVTISASGDGNRGQSSAIDALRLTIPYASSAAKLLHAWGGNSWFRDPWNVRFMEVPEKAGPVFSSLDKKLIRTADGLRGSFVPYVMLTGDRRGMAWFAENDRGWTQSTNTPGVVVERSPNGAVVLALNIVSEPLTLAKPRTFAFGLHPTPVKPLAPEWRNWAWWTVAPDSFCGFGMKGENPSATQFNRFPESWELAKARFARGWGNAGNHPLSVLVPGIYYDFRGIGSPPDDAKEWWDDWYGYGWGKGGDTLRYTPECVDFTAYYHNEWVRRGVAFGIYMDDAWNAPQRVVPGPVAYLLEDGHTQPGFEWRGQRESLKRMRQIFYDHGLTPHMCIHLTHTHYPMWLSFFDVMYDGEDHDLRPAGSPQDFMDFWPPFRLRFHNTQKWGVAPFFHGWIGNAMREKMGVMPTWTFRQGRAYGAALLVHDLGWLNGLESNQVFGETWGNWVKPNMLQRPENRFVGYWDPATPAAHTNRDLYVSVWKRDGWCAVALANWAVATNPLQAEVRLDLKAMGFGDVDPEAVKVRDVDATLLSYFDDDVTKLKGPDLPSQMDVTGKAAELEEFELYAPPTLAERKAADPDGKFEWKDGVLRCPVRRHDFRLFEFRAP